MMVTGYPTGHGLKLTAEDGRAVWVRPLSYVEAEDAAGKIKALRSDPSQPGTLVEVIPGLWVDAALLDGDYQIELH
jgi:hypothetical protein